MVDEFKCLCQYCESGVMEVYCSFLVNDCSFLWCKIVVDINLFIVDIVGQSMVVGEQLECFVIDVLKFIVMLVVVVILIVVVVVFVIMCGLLCQLGGELVYVMEIVQCIVYGDLVVEVVMWFNDQSSLLYVLCMMCDSFVVIVGEVWQGIDVIECVFIEIVFGNVDLFGCIECQVSLLEEIVSVMEQIILVVCQSVVNVEQVNILVVLVLEIVVIGGNMMGEVVVMMEDIC